MLDRMDKIDRMDSEQLQKITGRLRDEELDLRKQADKWANAGAHETARAFAEKANTMDKAVAIVIAVANEDPEVRGE